MSRARQPSAARPTAEQRTLDFEAERDAETTSWERAAPQAALIERLGRYGWTVMLPGGDAHVCALGRRDDGLYVGFCKCKGYRYHDGACAHLCTLRKADFLGEVETTGGEIVAIAPTVEREAGSRPDLSALTDAERRIYQAVEREGMGVREYQRQQGWASPGTASNLLRRARSKVDDEHRQAQQSGEVFEGGRHDAR